MHLIQHEKQDRIEELRPLTSNKMIDSNGSESLAILETFMPFIILAIAAVLGGYIISKYKLPEWTYWLVGAILLIALLVIVF